MACDESHAMRPSFYDSSSPFFSAIVVARHLSLSLSVCCAFESFGQVFLLKIIIASPKRCRFYM